MNIENSPHECAFVIPTYTNHKGLHKLLQDIASYESSHPIVVVNNNANIDVSKKLIPLFSSLTLKVIQNYKNLGYAQAINNGAQLAKNQFNPTYLVFLNDDISFSHTWIKKLLRIMKKNKWQIGAPLLKDNTGHIENYGYSILPYGKIRELELPQSTYDGLTGAALIVETKVFNLLGGYDERFFAYLEDVDLFIRAQKANIRYGLTNQVVLTHLGQQTSTHMSTFKAWLDFRNWIYLIGKHWGIKKLIIYFPQILIERLRNLSGLLKSLPYLKGKSAIDV